MVGPQAYDYIAKMVFLGDSGVGKSSLMTRFVENSFNPDNVSTIGVDFAATILKVENATIKLQIWDTAGQEGFRSITQSYMRNIAVALLVYDVNRPASFESIAMWREMLYQHNDNEKIVIVLVGNKSDATGQSTNRVSRARAQEFAKRHKMLFIETSAADDVNVQEVFNLALKEVHHRVSTNQLSLAHGLQGVKLPVDRELPSTSKKVRYERESRQSSCCQ